MTRTSLLSGKPSCITTARSVHCTQEAGPLLTDNPDISMELDNSMGELDSLSVEIRKDLNDNIANEEVVEALIRNYRLRIELLEDMLVLMKEKETGNKNYSDHEL